MKSLWSLGHDWLGKGFSGAEIQVSYRAIQFIWDSIELLSNLSFFVENNILMSCGFDKRSLSSNADLILSLSCDFK